jgi:hypothetical protein
MICWLLLVRETLALVISYYVLEKVEQARCAANCELLPSYELVVPIAQHAHLKRHKPTRP